MRFPMRNDLIVLILATVASYPIGLAIGHPWVLPILNALPAYVVLVHRLRKGERGGTVRAMLWWAATLAIVGTVAFVWWPEPLGRVVLNGPAYKNEMFNWIRTGPRGRGQHPPLPPGAPRAPRGVPRGGHRHGQRRRDRDGRGADELHVVLRGCAREGRGAARGR